MCAWHAAARGKKVIVLERSKQTGRKILMSGGGRCNFTNLNVTAEDFICANSHFVKSAISQYTAWDFINSVIEHGIPYEERLHGQLFCKNKSKDIHKLLLDECSSAGVTIVTHCDIRTVSFSKLYTTVSNRGDFQSKALVVATGGLSIPSLGTTPFGYELAQQFGMKTRAIRASLAPITFSGQLKDIFSRLSGVSIMAELRIGAIEFREALLFTHRGLSGPAVLQISNYWSPGQSIELNLIPDFSVTDYLIASKIDNPRSVLRTILAKHLPKNLILELESLWWDKAKGKPIGEWSDSQIHSLAVKLNCWKITPSGTEGYRTAEVTLGGVDTNQLSSKTLESTTQPGLFFIGEVVDVTGHLGGFNFQWAWSSGYICAQAL